MNAKLLKSNLTFLNLKDPTIAKTLLEIKQLKDDETKPERDINLANIKTEIEKLKAENEKLKKENNKSKDKKTFLDEFKPFLKTVVDMQYYTFQTINKYKQNFLDIQQELQHIKHSLLGSSNNNELNNLKSNWEIPDNKSKDRLKAKDIEQSKTLSNLKNSIQSAVNLRDKLKERSDFTPSKNKSSLSKFDSKPSSNSLNLGIDLIKSFTVSFL